MTKKCYSNNLTNSARGIFVLIVVLLNSSLVIRNSSKTGVIVKHFVWLVYYFGVI